MAIPVQQFAVPSFEESTPALTGVGKGIGLSEQLEQLMAMPAQRQRTEALANIARQQAKFLPLKMAIQAAQQQQVSGRFGPIYQLARWVMSKGPGQRTQWFANNPDKAKLVESVLGGQVMAQASGKTSPQSDLVTSLLQKEFPQYYQQSGQPQQMGVQPQPTVQPQQITGQTGTTQQLTGQQPGGQQQVTSPTSTQVEVSDSAKSWENIPEPMVNSSLNQDQMLQYASNRDNTSSDANSRAAASVGGESMLFKNREKYSKWINNALQYAGAKGRGKKYFDQWRNKNPDAVEGYRSYTTILVPGLKNIIKRTEGMGSTDSQRQELEKMVNQIDSITSNPEQAKRGVNNFVDFLHDIAQGNYDSAEPISKGLYAKMAGSAGFKPGNYLGDPKKEAPAEDTVMMKTPDGKVWHIPKSKVSMAMTRGAERVE